MAPKGNLLTLHNVPESMVSLILSIIHKKEAVPYSIVPREWKPFYTFNIKFPGGFFYSSCNPAEMENIIESIFDNHCRELERFEFNNIKSYCTTSKICDWIQRAGLKGVREIKIEDNNLQICNVQAPYTIFWCRSLNSLALKSFILINIPVGFLGFPSLTQLALYNVLLNDMIMDEMLQSCPCLNVLILRYCKGLNRLKICSDKLVSLNLACNIKNLIAICLRLVSLTMDCMLLNEMETEFYFPACLDLCTDAPLKYFRALRTLKKITILDGAVFSGDVTIVTEFRDLEQVCIKNAEYFSPETYSPGRQDETVLTLDKIEAVHMNITYLYDPIPLLNYLFRVAPALKTLLVSREEGFDGDMALEYINVLMNHQRPSTDTKVLISGSTPNEVRCVNCGLEKVLYDWNKIL